MRIWLISLIVSLSLSAWAEDVKATDKDCFKKVSVPMGASLTISLDRTHKTDIKKSRQWSYLVREFDKKHLTLTGESKKSSGRESVFHFKPVARGKSQIKLDYCTREESGWSAPLKQYLLEVETL